MVGLRHVATLVGQADIPLGTVTGLVLSGPDRLYTIARTESGFGVFDIAGAGAPLLLGRTAYRGGVPLVGFAPMAIEIALSATKTVLMPAGLNSAASSTYLVTSTGLLGSVVKWESGKAPPSDLALIQQIAGTLTPSIIGIRKDGSLLPFTLGDGGRLSAHSSDYVVPQAGGAVSALQTLQVGGLTLLVTASASGQSLVSYSILPDLRLERISLIEGPTSGIGFAAPSALRTVTLGDNVHVLLAGAGSSSLTVFSLLPDGTLVPTDHILDSRDSRFQAVTVVETLTLGDRVFVLAAGADDGLTLLTLLPGGHLLHLASMADTLDMTLGAISALAARATANGGGEIFVASARDAGLTRLALDFVPGIVLQGGAGTLTGTSEDDLLMAGTDDTLVQGGAGDDILVSAAGAGATVQLQGGAGKDVFVILPGARTTIISDYNPASDRIDLTFLPMLRGLGQIQITPNLTGAVLQYGDTVIEILTSNGRALLPRDMVDATFLPISRFDPTPPAPLPTGMTMHLGGVGGVATGGDGNDTLQGGAGNDTIRGNGGDDRIEGGAGDDNIGGGEGDDLILVQSGANMIWGGLGNDTVQGGSGADTIDGGGNGHNQLFGNGGDDWIFAGTAGDFIDGGDGNDLIRGGDGDDTIYAGTGNDNIGGGAGDDLIFAVAGHNVIWGGLGNDILHGAEGSDTLYGGPGLNQIFGNGGDDWIFAGSDGDLIGGGTGNDVIRGGDGADTIYGGLGNDNIGGGAGNDEIYGSAGANWIWGGLGNDSINAGTGRDVVTGGAGADVFVFNSAAHIGIAAGRDVIADFTPGVDKIDLRGLGASFNGTVGLLPESGPSFYYYAPAGLLIGDQNGDLIADWVLELVGRPAVTADDFLL